MNARTAIASPAEMSSCAASAAHEGSERRADDREAEEHRLEPVLDVDVGDPEDDPRRGGGDCQQDAEALPRRVDVVVLVLEGGHLADANGPVGRSSSGVTPRRPAARSATAGCSRP